MQNDDILGGIRSVKAIAVVGAVAVVGATTLVVLNFALRNYHQTLSDQVAGEKAAPQTSDLPAHRKAEQDALAAAKLDQAMVRLAKGVRAESIAPQPSDDIAPMKGWTKLPKPAPTPEPPAAGEAPRTADAGVRAAAPQGLASDAGTAPKGAPAKKH